ncbi:FAD-dependent oxidoreductase [Streptomyces sp. CG1]|uniref:FAD-dependent oxidoreductase n=1 Tax=Streptomyces sp. CG1 TaxID=1287523 RepID=UPI0034E24461
MHAGTGQAALHAAGLLDRFRALARPEGQEWRLLDPVTATALPFPRPVHDDDSPEIDRGQLRGMFLDSLVEGTVRWGCTVTGATPLGDGTWRLPLDDGTTEDADLVVGADGAWSRIRPALSDATPGYTGATFIETDFDDCDTRHPALARMGGHTRMAHIRTQPPQGPRPRGTSTGSYLPERNLVQHASGQVVDPAANLVHDRGR